MKKSVKIDIYHDCTTEWGGPSWYYVLTVCGDHIQIGRSSWYLRDADNTLICCGSIAELHGDGTDELDVKFKYVVSY